MAAVSLLWNTNMADVTSCENALFNERIFVYNFSCNTVKNSLDAERLQLMRKSYLTFSKEELLRATRK